MMIAIDLLNLQGIKAFSTERGCREVDSPHDGFSACDYVSGADFASAGECRRLLAAHCGVAPERLIFPRQTHSASVAIVDDSNVGSPFESVDALVTKLDSVALGINTADCAPLVMADAVAGVIAACHSGWRGTEANIAGATLEAMTKLGADPSRVVAAIGPMICQRCFEVGPEVAARFDAAFVATPAGGKPHIDLAAVIVGQLCSGGVPRASIGLPPACSRCSHHRFFSARRLGIASGRTATVIVNGAATGPLLVR